MPARAFRFALLAALTFFACAALAQKTIHVPADQPTIQAGINAASTGDTVLVSPGTYYENIDFKGKAITVTSSDGAAKTTIDGSGKGAAASFLNKEPRSAILSSFTITHGGLAPVNGQYSGAGIHLRQSRPTILNNVITENYCTNIQGSYSGELLQGNVISHSLNPERCFVSETGGYYHYGDYSEVLSFPQVNITSPLVIGNTIEYNSTGQTGTGGGDGGAGIALWGGGPAIIGNIIRNNKTRGDGAINIVYGNGVTIAQNLIYSNTGGCLTGGLSLKSDPLGAGIDSIVANNTIFDNIWNGPGGYSNCAPNSQVFAGGTGEILVNNIIAGNSTAPAIECGALYANSVPREDAQPILDHNLLWNTGGPVFSPHCVDVSAKYANRVADPLFANSAAFDFHLTAGSPAIDHGNANALALVQKVSSQLLTKDIAGNPREQDATGKGYPVIDIGAYEFNGSLSVAPTRVVLTASSYYITAGTLLSFTATLSSGQGVPTGSVTLLENGQAIGTSVLQNGVASFANVKLEPGIHGLIARYSGEGAFPPSDSVVIIVTVQPYPTHISITSSPSPSDLGQTVVFTVTASSDDTGFIPTPITLTEGYPAVTLATLTPDSSGRATYTTSSLAVGTHYVAANYAGDATHAAETSTDIHVVRDPFATTTSFVVSPAACVAFVPETFSVTVTSYGGAVPTGIVLITELNATVNNSGLDPAGKASIPVTPQYAGFHSYTITFVPSGSFKGSSTQASIYCDAGKTTTTTLTGNPNPSLVSQQVILTASITSAGGVPTGSVQFTEGSTILGTGTLDPSGRASISLSTLSVGNHTITATYTPTSPYGPSSGTLVQQVLSGYATSTTISSSPNPSVQGQNVTFTAAIASPNGIPTGSVQFTDNLAVLATIPLDASGHAVFSTSSLTPGVHDIYATYLPSGSFSGSSGFVVQTVQAITNAVNLTSSLNPSNYGDPLTFTAFVSTNGAQPVSGSVTFYAGSSYLGKQAVDASGKASVTLPDPTLYFGVGTFSITASFTPAGGTTSTAQTMLAQSVKGLPTATVISATPSTGTAYSNTIALTATVVPVIAGKPTPAGSVLFYLNGAQLGTASLINGVATLATALPGGVNHIYGVYLAPSGGGYDGSTSNTIDVTITPAPSTLTITSATNPALALTPFGVTAHLMLNGSQPAPAGLQITFTVLTLNRVVTAVTATTNASGIAGTPLTLPAGTYTIVASFQGNLSILASVSTPMSQIVLAQSTSISLNASPNPAYENQPVNFTVALSSALPPTGSATVFDGNTALQSLVFDGTKSSASFTLNNLAVGTHSLRALFSPADSNFLPSSTAAVSLIILPQSFTVTLSDDHPSIVTGHHKAITVSINSIGGLAAPFTLACGPGLPQWTTCSWGKSELDLPANGTVSTALTIDTDQLPGFFAMRANPAGGSPFRNIRFALLPLALVVFARRRALRSRLPRLLSLLAIALAASTLTGCGANKYPYSTAPGTYTIPIVVTEHPTTAGSNIISRTVNVTLTVTN